MIELKEWIQSRPLAAKPCLMLGKGPSFSQHADFDLGQFNLVALNHVVRELKVDVASAIDVDVVESCADAIRTNCRYLLMPRRPHVGFQPGPLLEEHVRRLPILRELDEQGRLVWYNLSTSSPIGSSPIVDVRYFSSEACLTILGVLGVKTVRSLGIDGGRGYSKTFSQLEGKTMLANGQQSFDCQLQEITRIAEKYAIDYQPLAEPMHVFVGTDESQIVATRVLEHSIRKHASRPVVVHPMLNVRAPVPRDKANRQRTGFSFARFVIPQLCQYRGRALYVDADMQVFSDLAELWNIPFGEQKVLCTNQPAPPEAWKNNNWFHSGRQMSVMLLDCARLDWNINDIVRGLDEGRYDYSQLMFELCLAKPNEIADRIPPEWNCLEWHQAAKTRLLHYTVVPTQPWKNDANPLRAIWEAEYREAVTAGAVTALDVVDGVSQGHLKRSLLDVFSKVEIADAMKASRQNRAIHLLKRYVPRRIARAANRLVFQRLRKAG